MERIIVEQCDKCGVFYGFHTKHCPKNGYVPEPTDEEKEILRLNEELNDLRNELDEARALLMAVYITQSYNRIEGPSTVTDLVLVKRLREFCDRLAVKNKLSISDVENAGG